MINEFDKIDFFKLDRCDLRFKRLPIVVLKFSSKKNDMSVWANFDNSMFESRPNNDERACSVE